MYDPQCNILPVMSLYKLTGINDIEHNKVYIVTQLQNIFKQNITMKF